MAASDVASSSDLVRDNLTGGMMTRENFYKRLALVQEEIRATIPEGVSLVDELIADRRAAAAREDAQWESSS